jgi:hypothetical protein
MRVISIKLKNYTICWEIPILKYKKKIKVIILIIKMKPYISKRNNQQEINLNLIKKNIRK